MLVQRDLNELRDLHMGVSTGPEYISLIKCRTAGRMKLTWCIRIHGNAVRFKLRRCFEVKSNPWKLPDTVPYLRSGSDLGQQICSWNMR